MISRTSEDYKKLFQSLLPPGKLWTRDPDAVLTQVLHGLATEFSRIEGRGYDLFNESLPSQVEELIADYEDDYGIYEENLELGKTIEQRVATIVTKYLETGGTYAGYFEGIASDLGYTITIDYASPFWCNIGTCIDPVGELVNLFWWRVFITIEENINYNIEQLMHEFVKYKPGHTLVVFDFYGRGFSRGFSAGFNAFPDFDNSWGDNGYGKIGDKGLGFGRGFSNAFANAYDYDGIMLTGGFSHGFSIGMNRYSGGGFKHHPFTNGFFKPH